MRKLLWIIAVIILIASCGKKKKKPSMTGEDKVEITDFITYFQPVNLPFVYADSNINKKQKDTLLINYKVFTQFVPDSLLGKLYGKNAKPKIYAMGRVEGPRQETYLFIKSIVADKKSIFILAFDKNKKYAGALASLRPDQNRSTFQSMTMDRKFSITQTVQRKNADGSTSEGKDVYAYDYDIRNFSLVMTDALDDKPTEVLNPIDTLPRKNKWSADYTNGKMNLVSIRDGRKSDRISFFIHFEKNNGECSGELKGEARISSASAAEFKVDGDPCILSFVFSSGAVRLKEVEGCGNHRGLQCLFDGSFARKKEIKPKKPAKK